MVHDIGADLLPLILAVFVKKTSMLLIGIQVGAGDHRDAYDCNLVDFSNAHPLASGIT